MGFKYKFNEHQEAWLRDLETTDAKQAIGVLYRKNGVESFCCLGRACVVLEKPLNLTRVDTQSTDNSTIVGFGSRVDVYDDVLVSVLPFVVQKALNLRQPNGMFGGYIQFDDKKYGSLTELNDLKQMSFAEIAKYCREHPEVVFIDYDRQLYEYRNSNSEH
jgi:hypothetical protein